LKKVKGIDKWKKWDGQLNDDFLLFGVEEKSKSVTCTFDIPKI
jgi:hypothetical protein